jgi:hypothetical protein
MERCELMKKKRERTVAEAFVEYMQNIEHAETMRIIWINS